MMANILMCVYKGQIETVCPQWPLVTFSGLVAILTCFPLDSYKNLVSDISSL